MRLSEAEALGLIQSHHVQKACIVTDTYTSGDPHFPHVDGEIRHIPVGGVVTERRIGDLTIQAIHIHDPKQITGYEAAEPDGPPVIPVYWAPSVAEESVISTG